MNSEKQPSLTAARVAVLVMFLANGIVVGSWLSRIPEFQARFTLTEAALGITLLFGSAGTIAALAVTSGFIARYSSRTITLLGLLLCSIALPLIALMPHPVALAAGLFFFGVSITFMDVAMNTQGAEVERRRGQPMMSSFHAAWSIGVFVGSGITRMMLTILVPPLMHYAGISVTLLIIAVVTWRFLLPAHHEAGAEARDPGQKESVFQFPARALWPIGLVALCSGLGEGSVGDWSGVYLRSTIGAPADVAPMGLVAFSALMTVGRLLGDWMTVRFKPVNVVRFGSALAGLGLLAVVLFPQTTIALIGFGAVGLGVANGVPLAFSAGGNVPGVPPSKGIAGVATIGYAAFLAGPPVIGLIAQATSLRISLGLVALAVGSVIFTANAMRQTAAPPAAQEA